MVCLPCINGAAWFHACIGYNFSPICFFCRHLMIFSLWIASFITAKIAIEWNCGDNLRCQLSRLYSDIYLKAKKLYGKRTVLYLKTSLKHDWFS